MNGEFTHKGRVYLSSRRACRLARMSWRELRDLVDEGLIEARTIGRLSYIDKISLAAYLRSVSARERDDTLRHAAETEPRGALAFSALSGLLIGMALMVVFHFIPRNGMYGSASIAAAIAPINSVRIVKPTLIDADQSARALGRAAALFTAVDAAPRLAAARLVMRTVLPNGFFRLPAAAASGTEHAPGTQTGVVVAPLGDGSADELSHRVRNAFSDEVRVVPDADGVSGIIQPIFKSGAGEEYMYVIVPVR